MCIQVTINWADVFKNTYVYTAGHINVTLINKNRDEFLKEQEGVFGRLW